MYQGSSIPEFVLALCIAELYVECNSGIKTDKAGSVPGPASRAGEVQHLAPGLIGAH